MLFHVLAIMHCKIHTESNHTLSDYAARVIQCLLITKLRSDVCVEKGELCAVFHGVYVRTAGEGFRRFSISKYAQTSAENPSIILKNSKCLRVNCSAS